MAAEVVLMGRDLMASRLEDRLHSGEQVVYSARQNLASTVVFIVIFSAVLSVAFLAVELVFSIGPNWQTWITGILVFAVLFLWRFWNRTVLVTDRRVLYAHRDDWKKKVTEVPLEMIERVALTRVIGNMGGVVTIYYHDGEKINLGPVPKLESLRDAIARQCGLP